MNRKSVTDVNFHKIYYIAGREYCGEWRAVLLGVAKISTPTSYNQTNITLLMKSNPDCLVVVWKRIFFRQGRSSPNGQSRISHEVDKAEASGARFLLEAQKSAENVLNKNIGIRAPNMNLFLR